MLIDRPLAIQLYGHVIPEMELAARWVEAHGASVVDINMGCPVRKVVRSGGGSALLCQVDRAVELVGAVVRAVAIPVTVKMRLGWDDQSLTAPILAREFEQVGAAAVIVHGRTRAEGFSALSTAKAFAPWSMPCNAFPWWPTVTYEQLPMPRRCSRRQAARPFRLAAERLPIRSSSASSAIGRTQASRGQTLGFEERLDLMSGHFHGLVDRRGEFYACLQFRKILKWYYHFTRMPKSFYLRLIKLSSVALFDETVAAVRVAGPSCSLPGHFEVHVPVPSGAIDKW